MNQQAHLLLSDAERERFIRYLEHEAHTTAGIIEQMGKIRTPPALVAVLKAECAAFLLIARKLRKTESVSLGGGETDPP